MLARWQRTFNHYQTYQWQKTTVSTPSLLYNWHDCDNETVVPDSRSIEAHQHLRHGLTVTAIQRSRRHTPSPCHSVAIRWFLSSPNIIWIAVNILAGTSWRGGLFNPTVSQFFLRNQWPGCHSLGGWGSFIPLTTVLPLNLDRYTGWWVILSGRDSFSSLG